MGVFIETAAQFSFSDAEDQRCEQLRQDFLQRFPASKLPDLKIEEYALGLDPKENSFCWWLEFKTADLGSIGGATALKHVVFYSRDKQQYVFENRYSTYEAAFEAARKGLVELIALAAAEQYDKLDKVVPFEKQNLTRGKILYLYHAEKFLPIFSIEHLKDFCVQFGVQADFESQTAMNIALLSFKRSQPEVAHWSNQKFATFLYEKFPPTVQFWKVAPGKNAVLWNECQQGGFICVGWSEIADMREQTDGSAFREMYRQLHPAPGSFRQWKEIWGFAKEIKKGDRIIANNGMTSIVGIGTVSGEYYYDQNRADYKHLIPVRWENTAEFSIPDSARNIVSNWFSGTVKQISREEYQQIVVGAKPSTKPVWRRSTEFDLILTNPSILDLDAAKSLYSQVVATEHGDISQHVRNEFRQWLDDATAVLGAEAYVTLSNWFLSTRIYTETKRAELAAKLWDILFAVRPERLSDPARNSKVIPTVFEAWWAKMRAAGAALDNDSAKRNITESPSGRYSEICQTTFLPEKFFQNCERLLETKKQIVLQGAPGTGKTFVAEKIALLWAGERSRVKIVQFHESFGYEDFIYGIKPRVDPETKRTAFYPEPGLFLRFCEEIRNCASGQRYVLLIDEINRAKTARVFGELLYLLEYRDRAVELQSGTTFSIPPNLYIIGTMNTTDKSIALVDYALRRRFAFIDLVPVKNGSSVVLRKWLDANGISNAEEIDRLFIALNEAIAHKDEALLIGHSYFMLKQASDEKHFSSELLDFIWEYYILPLIAEYEYQLSRTELEEKYGLNAFRSGMKAKAATV